MGKRCKHGRNTSLIYWFICAALWATSNHNISLFVQHVRDIHWSIENPKHFVDANSGKEFDGKYFHFKTHGVVHNYLPNAMSIFTKRENHQHVHRMTSKLTKRIIRHIAS
jgi:hypothetical protein